MTDSHPGAEYKHIRQRQLEREEYAAREEVRQARARYQEIISEIPSGLPPPDGAARIQRAGAAVRYYEQKLSQASRRLMDFLVAHPKPQPAKPTQKDSEGRQLMQAYRAAVEHLDLLVKRLRDSAGGEHERSQKDVRAAGEACESACRRIVEYLEKSGG